MHFFFRIKLLLAIRTCRWYLVGRSRQKTNFRRCKLCNFAVESINRISISTSVVFVVCRSWKRSWSWNDATAIDKRKGKFRVGRNGEGLMQFTGEPERLLLPSLVETNPTWKRYAQTFTNKALKQLGGDFIGRPFKIQREGAFIRW